MKILYLDGASGASGDMILGVLVDLGLGIERLRSLLAPLKLRGVEVSSRQVRRGGFGARKVDVRVKGRPGHRGLKEIRSLIEGSALDASVKKASMEVFRRIIKEEARIHRIAEQKVHLHEVGAVDAIVDVVGAVAGLRELLGDGRLVCSPLNVGHGTVEMDHGVLPVPAPATAALLRGVPTYSAGPPGERVTPTAAAILTTLADSFGPPPPLTIQSIGYGAGTREFEGQPNVLRGMLGTSWSGAAQAGTDLMVIECSVDDMNPQTCGYLMERLFETGALEVFYTPVQMKKNRPGVLLTVICAVEDLNRAARVIFEESTTIGLRYRPASRLELAREVVTVSTRYGKVRGKISSLEGTILQAQPEYDDCRRIARRRKISLKEVLAAAAAALPSPGSPTG